MFLTRIPRARSASPRSGCPSRGEAQRRVTAPRIELAPLRAPTTHGEVGRPSERECREYAEKFGS